MKFEKSEDPRVVFANDVCKLVMEACQFEILTSVKVIKPFYDHFKENVRNIYQFIGSSIPLFALYEFYEGGDIIEMAHEEHGLSKDELEVIIVEACLDFYERPL